MLRVVNVHIYLKTEGEISEYELSEKNIQGYIFEEPLVEFVKHAL